MTDKLPTDTELLDWLNDKSFCEHRRRRPKGWRCHLVMTGWRVYETHEWRLLGVA